MLTLSGSQEMRDTIIIVEGPQGAGKTTFTNYLREKMTLKIE